MQIAVEACDIYARPVDGVVPNAIFVDRELEVILAYTRDVADTFARAARRDASFEDLTDAATRIESAWKQFSRIVSEWGPDSDDWPPDVQESAFGALTRTQDEMDTITSRCRVLRAD